MSETNAWREWGERAARNIQDIKESANVSQETAEQLYFANLLGGAGADMLAAMKLHRETLVEFGPRTDASIVAQQRILDAARKLRDGGEQKKEWETG